MKRQITTTIFELGTRELVKAADGRYDEVEYKVCEVETTSFTKTQIRSELKAAGAMVPRGTEVYAKPLYQKRYFFEFEKLLEIADSVEVITTED